MQILEANDVKIYNLSSGKSIPEWIADRKRRKLEQKDIDIRRRIQLIQDFEMPDLSRTIDISPDGRYIFATGTYKPFLKCFDVNDLALKFSRGLDAEVVKMIVLSDDYSKFILLEEERYVEMHAAFGRFFRMRIPKFGHDMSFCREASDLYIVGSRYGYMFSTANCLVLYAAFGASGFRVQSAIFISNEGKFLEPLRTTSPSLMCCEFSSDHQLFVCGGSDGLVSAWDHRDRSNCGILDCSMYLQSENYFKGVVPEVSAIKFRDALHLGVGLSTGHIILYDIRSRRPLLIKDHNTGLPIKRLDYVPEQNFVLSMDLRVLKIWNDTTGKPFVAIEPPTDLNDFCRCSNSGLLFIANEAPKILQYFVPAIGPAPKWCSYLETITEEFEETEQNAVYDDYKFVTAKDLEEIGLAHLIGTNVLRAYMHGYFIDVKLYNRAKTLTQPLAYENYKQRKIREIIDAEGAPPSLINNKEAKLPTVNKDLALKYIVEEKSSKKKKNKKGESILTDTRFKSLFSNPDFEIDENSERYQLIQPAIKKIKDRQEKLLDDNSHEAGTKSETTSSLYMDDSQSDQSTSSSESDVDTMSSSDAELDDEDGNTESSASNNETIETVVKELSFENKPTGYELIELEEGEDLEQLIGQGSSQKVNEETLREKRETIACDGSNMQQAFSFGERQLTFKPRLQGAAITNELRAEKQARHLKERKELRRDTREITRTLKKLPIEKKFKFRKCRH